jgi:hypothetical protein
MKAIVPAGSTDKLILDFRFAIFDCKRFFFVDIFGGAVFEIQNLKSQI